MHIFVQAKPRASKDSVRRIDETHFIVSVKEPPLQGRANAAIIAVLAQTLGVSSSRLKIIAGRTLRRKVIEIR